MTDRNLYMSSGEPGCALGLVVLRTPAQYLVLTHRGLRTASKDAAVIAPGHADYPRADEVWQTAFAALRLASLPLAPAQAVPVLPAVAGAPTNPEQRVISREQRLATLRRLLRGKARTLDELAQAMNVRRDYVRQIFKRLVDAGEGRRAGDRCELVPSGKRDRARSLGLVRDALREGSRTFAELAQATGLSATYSRRLAIHLLETGEARQLDGWIELVPRARSAT